MILLLRIACRWATLFYLVVLLALLGVLHWMGERWGLLAILVFLPAPVFLLPMLLLGPLCLLLGLWRMVLLQLVCAAVLAFGYMTFGFGSSLPGHRPDLTVVTHNAGEGDRPGLIAFLAAQKPDVVLLQDVLGGAPGYTFRHPEFKVVAQGEFICMTRLPVLSSQLVTVPGWTGRPVAARFELQFGAEKIACYSVHLPTPRPQFQRFYSRNPLRGLVGYRTWLNERRALDDALAGVLAAETLPVLIGGDFNWPDHGVFYHRLSSRFIDTFAKAGQGWGFTFPGNSHNLLTRGPWLRLDYLWAGRGWEPLTASIATARIAQHRALVAKYAFKAGQAPASTPAAPSR